MYIIEMGVKTSLQENYGPVREKLRWPVLLLESCLPIT